MVQGVSTVVKVFIESGTCVTLSLVKVVQIFKIFSTYIYIYIYFKNTKNLFIHIAHIPLGDLLEIFTTF